ncbi:hypothetical protein HMPREF0043_00136 [Actinobaculum sp. oral taxon 183 str. F0552]|nr:hypothetical protein HMPREF0043_00136 [Actinobaculum sp. oral taxon 183 str. F0552]
MPASFGSEGWGFESLRARRGSALVETTPGAEFSPLLLNRPFCRHWLRSITDRDSHRPTGTARIYWVRNV